MSRLPAIVIRIPLESAPEVSVECADESQVPRIADWVNAHPELVELVEQAVDLANVEAP